MKVRIYRPAKTAMQSGKARTKKWLVEFIEEKNSRNFDKIMGWTSIDNTLSELHFAFNSKEEAIDFASKKNLEFIVEEPLFSSLKKKSYADNFL